MKIPTDSQLLYLQDNYFYEAHNGDIFRKPFAKCQSRLQIIIQGTIVGRPTPLGYLIINIRPIKASFLAHRLAWYLYYDEWPQLAIDHIDGHPANNAITNLRLATPQQNSYNKHKKLTPQTTNIYKGITYNKEKGQWLAHISKDWKTYYLGSFGFAEEAALAYDQAAVKLFGEFACLNFEKLRALHT
jgi:hypothetical protein